MKKILICLIILLSLTGCSNYKDDLECTLQRGSSTSILKIKFKEGKYVSSTNEYRLNIGNMTEQEANNKIKELTDTFTNDGFENVKGSIYNEKVIIINSEVDIEKFINLDTYLEIKDYYNKMGYTCK